MASFLTGPDTRMKIRQYIEGLLPCTAPHLLIRVTFSTPAAKITSNQVGDSLELAPGHSG